MPYNTANNVYNYFRIDISRITSMHPICRKSMYISDLNALSQFQEYTSPIYSRSVSCTHITANQ